MKMKFVGFLATLCLLAPASMGWAQQLDEAQMPDFTTGVRPSGMGEAFTAVASGVGTLYHNPAGVARAVMYALEGGFEYTPDGSLLNAAVVDSRTNPAIAAGVAYSHFFGRGELSHFSHHDIRASIAVPVVPDRVAVGVGGRYLILTDTRIVVDPTDDDANQRLIQGFTLDIGVLFRVAEMLHLGIAGQNLIDPCDDEACRGFAPTLITAGAALGRETSFMVSADVGVDLTSLDEAALHVGVGGEYLIARIAPIRAGYLYKAATG
ncbi:MAG: hypothetical protein ACNA8W_07225, partial [Bradymonadaceae bacterium]